MKYKLKDTKTTAHIQGVRPYPCSCSHNRRLPKQEMEAMPAFTSDGTPLAFPPLLAILAPFLTAAATAGAGAVGGAAIKGIADGIARKASGEKDMESAIAKSIGGNRMRSTVPIMGMQK